MLHLIMKQTLISRIPTLTVWACIGIGTMTLLWTILTIGRPEWLEHPVADWLKPEPAELRSAFGALPLEMRKVLARRVLNLQRDINAHNGLTTLREKWATELNNIAAVLDPRINLQDLRAPTLVCPEKHNGAKFVTKPCNYSQKINDMVTVVLPARGWTPERVSQVLDGFNHHKIAVILIIDDDVPVPQLNVSVLLTYAESVSDGKALNDAMSMVETPFVLFGTSLSYFSESHASLTRLIRVMDQQPSVSVVGGGMRDIYGQWRHGCIQRSITNYHATFIHGYEYSHQECMYCDDIIGPFMTKSRLLKEEPFNEDITGPVVYHDWYTTLSQAGYLSMVCPDVMFFIEEEPIVEESDWEEYGRQWSIISIDSFKDTKFRFSCSQVHLNCNDLQKKISWFLIPPCCREIIMKGITFVHKFAQEKGIDYEMHHGSLLGAIKLGSYLPWDFDQDIYYDCRDKSIWHSINYFLRDNKASCSLRLSNTQTQLVIQCKTFFIDMVCRKPLTRFTLPEIYRNISTWINYGGYKVNVMANPGSAARDQGGVENLRHAQHWRVRNHPDAGAWRPCRIFRQSCLDKHPADGSIAFTNPPKCLP